MFNSLKRSRFFQEMLLCFISSWRMFQLLSRAGVLSILTSAVTWHKVVLQCFVIQNTCVGENSSRVLTHVCWWEQVACLGSENVLKLHVWCVTGPPIVSNITRIQLDVLCFSSSQYFKISEKRRNFNIQLSFSSQPQLIKVFEVSFKTFIDFQIYKILKVYEYGQQQVTWMLI